MTRTGCRFVGTLLELAVIGLVAPGCSDGRIIVAPLPVEATRAALHKGGLGAPVHHTFIGAFDPSLGDWYISMRRPGWSNDLGRDLHFRFGNPGDTPLVGDWDGDGVETQGVFRSGSWYLSNTLGHGWADLSFGYGNTDDLPIVGDWNGDGTATPGVFRNGTFLLRNTNTTGVADVSFAFGSPGDIPLAGDWNGDGIDTVGVYHPSTSTFILTNSPTGQTIDVSQPFGGPGSTPIVGDWDGDGQTTQGIWGAGAFLLGNDLHSGFADVYASYGAATYKPISGTWMAHPPTNDSTTTADLSTFFPIGINFQHHNRFQDWQHLGINTVTVVPSNGPEVDDVESWTHEANRLNMKMIRDARPNPADDNGETRLLAWYFNDEPDLGGMPTPAVIARYNLLKSTSTRPAFVNFDDDFVLKAYSQDPCGGPGDYPGEVTGCYPAYLPITDWISHDIYPINWGHGYGLDAGARAADKLRRWSSKPQHVYIEAAPNIYTNGSPGPSPGQLRAEVWLAIVHGARAISYFVTSFPPPAGTQIPDGSTPEIKAEMATQNARITGIPAAALQSQINPPGLGFTGNGATLGSAPPLEATWRQWGGHNYLIVVNPGAGTLTQNMNFVGLGAGTTQLTVMGEGRSVPITNGKFGDTFGPYEVHIYSS